MPTRTDIIPVVLFAYARPAHLRRVLGCLRAERVPKILAFADGAKGRSDAPGVAEVRGLLRGIDWCDVALVERPNNLGLGRNVLTGLDDAAARHGSFVVWEDDLVCVPGTYAWVTAALRRYTDEPRVMSVTAWTHPRITPPGVGAAPYFDGRAECWVWGTFARSWAGMERTALEKMAAVRAAGLAPDACGADLPRMARQERRKNIWAVRWLFHHLEHGGLCLRPPWSMVEHIGFDAEATNAAQAQRWANPPLRPAPSIPAEWPAATEHPACRDLWRQANPPEGVAAQARGKVAAAGRHLARLGKSAVRALLPEPVRRRLRSRWGWQWFRGDYATWAEAQAASGGYAADAILQRVLAATLAVRAGQAAFERDGVLFQDPEPDEPLLRALEEVRKAVGGKLRVLDFGGSLGTNYWRHRTYWAAGDVAAWDVVEQVHFVAAGRRHFGDGPVRFFADVCEAEAAGRHDVLLASTALQYLATPAMALAEWSGLPIPFLLLNNLPLHADGADRLRVQHVPPSIYAASYPVWFFNRAVFLARVEPAYTVVREFASEAVWPVDGGRYPSTGLLLKRKGRA